MEKSYFFDDTDGDREYAAADFADFLSGITQNGVVRVTDGSLIVTVGTGLQLNVAAGYGIINGRLYHNNASLSLALDAAHATYGRYDRVVLRLDTAQDTRSMVLAIVKGTPAASPTVPALINSGSVSEIAIANILVPATATSLLSGNLTDERINGGTVAQVVTGSYVGNGTGNPRVINIGFKPSLLMISNYNGSNPTHNLFGSLTATSSPNSVGIASTGINLATSNYSNFNWNVNGTTYNYVAFR